MALVEVARFLDLSEAQAAASALRASDIDVFMRNENWGQIETHLQLAVGGFPLFTHEYDAEDARAFVDAHRSPPVQPQSYPAVTFGVIVLTVLTGALAWLIAPLLRRRRTLAD